MEMLRIKCPSCGVILEVKNSKHEEVKKITCPSCKKQLAVTFADDPKPQSAVKSQPVGTLYEGQTAHQLFEGVNPIPHVPSGLVELRVVRLADGSCKHILRALTAEQKVLVNGQSLQQEDEVVLLRGDELEIDKQYFNFDKPGVVKSPVIAPPEKEEKPQEKPLPNRPNSRNLLILVFVAIVAGCIWWAFRASNHPDMKVPRDLDTVLVKKDTVKPVKTTTKPDPKESSPSTKKTDKAKESAPSGKKGDLTSMSLYSLELLANKNDVDAQFELGKRLVHTSGSKNIVMGINWLHKASLNGSSQAHQVMNKAIRSLQQKAAQGDTVAYHILNSIDIR